MKNKTPYSKLMLLVTVSLLMFSSTHPKSNNFGDCPDTEITPNDSNGPFSVACSTGDIIGFYADIFSGNPVIDVVDFPKMNGLQTVLSAPLSSATYSVQNLLRATNNSSIDPTNSELICVLSEEQLLLRYDDVPCSLSTTSLSPSKTTAPIHLNGKIYAIDVPNGGTAVGSPIDIELADLDIPTGLFSGLGLYSFPATSPYFFTHESMSSATNGVDDLYFISGSFLIIFSGVSTGAPSFTEFDLDPSRQYAYYGLEYLAPGKLLAIQNDYGSGVRAVDLVEINIGSGSPTITPIFNIENSLSPAPLGDVFSIDYYSTTIDTCNQCYYLSTQYDLSTQSRLVEIDLITLNHVEQIFPKHLFGIEMKAKPCGPCTASFDINYIDSCGHVQVTGTSTGPGPIDYLWCDGQAGSFLDLQLPCGPHTFCVTVTCGDGTTSTASVSVNIVDNIPPNIVCPPDIVVDCDDDFSPAFTGFATATDNCLITQPLTFVDDTLGMLPCDGIIQRTWTAVDWCNNTSSCIQNISVQDLTPPLLINCPGNVFMQGTVDSLGNCTAFVNLISPTATDNCSSVTLTNNINNTNDVSGIYNLGVTNVTWTATDSCGNVSTCSFPVTIACDSCYCATPDLVLSTMSGLQFPVICNLTDPSQFPVIPCLSGDISINGVTGCNSSNGTVCTPDVTWMLSGPSGPISSGGGLSGSISVTFPASLVSAPGIYTFVSITWCPGALEGCPCYIKWEQLPCSIVCCEDPMMFSQAMHNAVSVTSKDDSCSITVDIGLLAECDFFESIDWGDGHQDVGMFNSNTQYTHVYAASGNYNISLLGIELDSMGLYCLEIPVDTSITLTCLTGTSDLSYLWKNIDIIPNPVFRELTIRSAGNAFSESRLLIQDISGSVKITSNVPAGEYAHSVNMEELPEGVYIALLKQDGIMRWSKKFIKL